MRANVLHGLMLACVAVPLMWTAAAAEGVAFPGLEESVPGLQEVTYLDLARQVVPDLALSDGTYVGHKVIGVRDIAGGSEKTSPPPEISIFNIAVLPVLSDGKSRLLLLIDLGQGADNANGFAVLALYDLSGAPKLLDAANVAYDKETYFREPEKLSLGEGKDAVVTMSIHSNSSQAYITSVPILVRADRLELIDSVFTFNDQSCAFKRTQDASFAAVADQDRAYSGIAATVTETTVPSGDSCNGETPPRPSTREIVVTYRWDEAAGRFVKDSDALERLAKEDQERF